MISGGCLCGEVTFEIRGTLRPVVACHCIQCRKTSGHHVAATSAARKDVTITGTPVWYVSSPTAQRGFCGTCGSNLFWNGEGSNLSIFAGTIDGDPGLKLKGHIFCDFKGGYYEISDGLPQSDLDDPDLTTVVR